MQCAFEETSFSLESWTDSAFLIFSVVGIEVGLIVTFLNQVCKNSCGSLEVLEMPSLGTLLIGHSRASWLCALLALGQWVLGLVITDNSLVSDAGCASTVLWLSFGWLCTTWAFYFMPFLGHFGGVSRNFFTKIRVIDASFQLSSPKCNQRDKYIFYVGWNCNGPKVANFLDA